MTGPVTRLAVMFAVLLLSLGFSSAAHAHASLLSTVPGDGTMVATAPSAFSLTFNEPVSPLLVKLIDPDGSSVARLLPRSSSTNVAFSPSVLNSSTALIGSIESYRLYESGCSGFSTSV